MTEGLLMSEKTLETPPKLHFRLYPKHTHLFSHYLKFTHLTRNTLKQWQPNLSECAMDSDGFTTGAANVTHHP
jgi:hypothetical protein